MCILYFFNRVRDDAPRLEPTLTVKPANRKRHLSKKSEDDDSDSDEPSRIVLPHGSSPGQAVARISSKVVCLSSSSGQQQRQQEAEGSSGDEEYRREVRFGRKFKTDHTWPSLSQKKTCLCQIGVMLHCYLYVSCNTSGNIDQSNGIER